MHVQNIMEDTMDLGDMENEMVAKSGEYEWNGEITTTQQIMNMG